MGFKGRHDISAAFAVNLENGKIHQMLVPGKGIYTGQTSVGGVVGVSPDKKWAFMPAYKNQSELYLYKVNLSKLRNPKVFSRGTADTIDFFVNTNSEVIARERYHERSNLHRLEARVDDEWKVIFKEETTIRTKSFTGVTPDGKSLVMLTRDPEHGRVSYYTISLKDGAISEALFSHKDKSVESVLTDINRVVYGVRYSGFTPSYEFFDEKLNARMRGISKALPGFAFSIYDYTPDWKNMVLYMDGQDSAGEYILYKNGGLELLAKARPRIPNAAVNLSSAYTFSARDGLEIASILTLPNKKEAKNLPAIMMPHGGPESYDKLGFDWMSQYFASQGFAVIQPQFRGSDGFGVNHLLAGRGEWGQKMQDDLTDAVLDLAEKGVIDKNKVCIVGASYGGYAALAGVAFTPDIYKCAVSINGVSDVEEMLDTEKRDHGSHHWVVSYWQEVISKGEVDEDHLAKISPINYVQSVKTPLLLIHGERDEVVSVKQSRNMLEELEDADKEVKYLELEGGNHYLSRSENRMKAILAIDEFLKQHIKI